MQKTHTAYGTDLAAVAAACGFAKAEIIRGDRQIPALHSDIRRGQGPLFYQVKVKPDPVPPVLPPRDGAYLKHRFREALLGKTAAAQ
jgi:thiamine pyrophosphate-dependent acetolactate synthase large subunit-like protein